MRFYAFCQHRCPAVKIKQCYKLVLLNVTLWCKEQPIVLICELWCIKPTAKWIARVKVAGDAKAHRENEMKEPAE